VGGGSGKGLGTKGLRSNKKKRKDDEVVRLAMQLASMHCGALIHTASCIYRNAVRHVLCVMCCASCVLQHESYRLVLAHDLNSHASV